ncbi:Gfo/Idh/MocA family oxidoreductase [Myxococcota bacterium]|nr:Gfo/Idh/MocA family oxidoreductase [Myxococcota bacterium]
MREVHDVRVGVVGAGFLADTRARCWAQVRGARVVGSVAAHVERAQAWAARHGIAQVWDDVEAMVEGDGVDLVDLCVPNALHRPLAELAAAAGKHVLCTKPLTAYVGQDLPTDAADAEVANRSAREQWRVATADAEALSAATERAGVRLFYGENWLYAPAFQRALGLLETAASPVLEMRGWECHSGSHAAYARSWRLAGGGALLRLGAHPIGAMLHLKRNEGLRLDGAPIRPVSVTAEVADCSRAATQRGAAASVATDWGEVENWGSVVIAFEDGSRGVASGSDNWLGGMDSRLQLLAASCRVECNLSPNDLVRAYAADTEVFGDEVLMEKHGTSGGWSTPMPDEDWTSGQLPMCQAIADAVASGDPVAGDGELGVAVTSLVYAAYVSAAEGRRVELSELG